MRLGYHGTQKIKHIIEVSSSYPPRLYPLNLLSGFITSLINKRLARVKDYKITLGGLKIKPGVFSVYNLSVESPVSGMNMSLFIQSVEIGVSRKALWNGLIEWRFFIDSPVCKITNQNTGKTESQNKGTTSGILPEVAFVIENLEIFYPVNRIQVNFCGKFFWQDNSKFFEVTIKCITGKL